MDPSAVVLEISSDEDGDWGETKGISYDEDDHRWLTDLLEEVDYKGIDDSDEVVLVGEVLSNPNNKRKKLKPCLKGGLDDDECVILENDPDKPTPIQNDKGEDESDDILVVGEKGQVACRDYPHSRHQCIKFPFTSNSNERHCDQCYCYVCDSLAPCVYWGNGSSSIDHCHATDKDEFWKIERKNAKNGNIGVLPAAKVADASLSTRLPQMSQVPPASGPFQPMAVAHDPVSRPNPIGACSMPTNLGIIPNIIDQSRSRFVLPRNKFQPNLVSQQLHSTCNSNYSRDRVIHHNGNLGPKVAQAAAFKRTGSAGVAPTTNRCFYGSSLGNHGTRHLRKAPLVETPSNRNPSRSNTYLGSSKPQAIHSFDSLPSQTQVYSPPIMGTIFEKPIRAQSEFPPQPNAGTLFECPVNFQSQVPPLPDLGTLFENPIPFQSEVSSQPNGASTSVNLVPAQPQVLSQQNYSVPSQPQLSCHTNYPVASQPQLSSQPNYPVASQPQVNSESTSTLNYNCQNKSQQGDETQSSIDPNFTDFDFQVEGLAPTNETSLVVGSGFVDFQYDNWIFDNQPVEPGAGFTAVSPEHGLIDTINIFDF